MGPVQEKQVRSCFGRCKVNFQTGAYPAFHPRSLHPSASESLRSPRRKSSALSARAPVQFRTLPSPSEPRAQTAPSRAERHRAEPHRLFRPRLGAVHHSQRLKPHPSPVAGASTRLQAGHCRLQSSEVLKRPPLGEKCGAACIYRPARAPGRCNMHLVAKSNSPGPASPSIWVAQAPKKPQAKLPVAQWGAASRGTSAKKAPGSSRTKIRTFQADGRNCLRVAYSLPSWRRLEPACHACYTCKIFLHIGFEIASMLRLPPTFLRKGFLFSIVFLRDAITSAILSS